MWPGSACSWGLSTPSFFYGGIEALAFEFNTTLGSKDVLCFAFGETIYYCIQIFDVFLNSNTKKARKVHSL